MSRRAVADYTHEAADCRLAACVALRRRLAARKAEAGYRG
jgi:hypothetical protein